MSLRNRPQILFGKLRRKEAAMKKKNEMTGENKSELNKIFGSTRIAVIIITTITIISIIIITFIKSNNTVEKYEADLMASGLAIIGIAISVWAGLNIANSIERKDVEDIKSSVKGINEQFEDNKKEMESVKRNIEYAKKNVTDINKDVEAMRNERRDVNWNTFLLELLETCKDTVSRYFYTEFSTNPIEWKNLIEMVLLEQDFSQVYNNYSETSKVKKVLIDKAENGINRATRLEEEIGTINNPRLEKLIRIYLKYRITEFHFMNGYMVDKEKSYGEFKEAAKGFEKVCDLMEIDLQHADSISGKKLELAVYFANSIGESCSKVTHRENLPKDGALETEINRLRVEVNSYSEKAIYYLQLAIKLNKDFPQREVYYRNLGCAYERKDRNNNQFGKNAKNIIDNYREALNAVISSDEDKKNVQKIYHVLLSYYHWLMQKIFVFGDNENNVFSDLQRFEEFKASLRKDIPNGDAKRYLYDFNHVSELAVLDNPRFSINRLMYGFSISWIIVLLLNRNEEIKSKYNANSGVKYYLNEIEKCLIAVEVMQKNDDYYRDLKKRYETLTAYCNKK